MPHLKSTLLALTAWAAFLPATQGAPGDTDPTFDPDAGATVRAVAIQPDGKFIVGGTFTTMGGLPRYRIARLNADGTLESTFNPGADAEVASIAVQKDSKVILGGDFLIAAGIDRQRLARFTSDGLIDLSFYNYTNDNVETLVQQPDGKTYVAGAFTTISSTLRQLARVQTNGQTDSPGSAIVNGGVDSVAIQTDGKVIISGGFTTVNSTNRKYIARLNADGTLDPSFSAPAPNNPINAVCIQPDGKILIGGSFYMLGTTQKSKLARLNADGSLDNTFTYSTAAAGYPVETIALQTDGRIVIPNYEIVTGGLSEHYVIRVNSNGTLDSTFKAAKTTTTNDGLLLQADGKVVATGYFNKVGTTSRNNIGRILNDPATQSLTVPNTTRVQWLRGGSSPETQLVSFELSTNGGSTWTPLGAGTRIAGGWEKTGLNLPLSGKIRAQALVYGSRHNSSTSVLETVIDFDLLTQTPTLTAPTAGQLTGNPVTLTYSLPEAALNNTLRVTFFDGTFNRDLTLTGTLQTAGPHTVTFNPANPGASPSVLGSPLPDRVYSITLRYQDLAGNAVAASTTVTGVTIDTTAPTLALPQPITVEAQGPNGTTLNFNLSATDNFDAQPAIVAQPASGSTFGIGTTTVNVTATDDVGNTRNGSFTVKVQDTVAPVVTGNFAPLTLTTGAGGMAALPNYGPQANATDAVGVTGATQSPAPGDVHAGKTTVTITAIDAAGNKGTATFDVTVNDGTEPEIGAPDQGFQPLTLIAGANGTAILPDYTGQAETQDNVGVTEVTQVPAPGAQFGTGLRTVTLTAHDAAGNSKSLSLQVLVIDTTPPSIEAPGGGFAPATITTGADGTAALPDYTGQPLMQDNVGVTAVTQTPAAGSPRPAGTTTVTLTAHDASGNTKDLVFDVPVADGTKPEIATPNGGFTPLELTADADGMVTIPDYTGQAVTSDNVGVTSVTQVPPAGTPRLFGETVVTLTAHDAAGNTRDLNFPVVTSLTGRVLNALASTKDPVPGAGTDPRIPAGALFTSLGLPAVSDDRQICFLGKWKVGRVAGSGIFAGTTPELLVAVGEDAPGIPGAKFRTIQDPLLAPDGTVAFLATVQGGGVRPGNDLGVWMSSGGVHTLVLREGTQMNGAPDGFILKSISGLSLRNGALLVTARLAAVRKVTTAKDDDVLLRVTPAEVTVLLRENAPLDLHDDYPPSTIVKMTSLLPATGSPGHGRWQTDAGAAALVALADGRQVAVCLDADGTPTQSTGTGESVANLPDSAVWLSVNFPAAEPTGHAAAVRGTLIGIPIPKLPTQVTAQNDGLLAVSPDPSVGFELLAREGSQAAGAGEATFGVFSDPLINQAGTVAFVATLKGRGVIPENQTGLWWGRPEHLELLARTNFHVPDADGAETLSRWDRFVSVALPSGPNAGPILLARVRGHGVTPSNNTGLWAVDSTDKLRQLLRTGDEVQGRKVVGIQALTGAPGSLGAARGFNERGTLVARLQLTQGVATIVRIDIPEGRTRVVEENP